MIFHIANEEIKIGAAVATRNIKYEIPLRKNGEVIQSHHAVIEKLFYCATIISALWNLSMMGAWQFTWFT